jgi:hypothetical protein
MSALPCQFVCIEKKRLQDAFAWAVSEYNRMNTAQALALMRGEGFRFNEQIAETAQRKDEAKYAVLKHEQDHGC